MQSGLLPVAPIRYQLNSPGLGFPAGFLSVKKKVLKKAVTKRSSPETLAGLKKKIAAQAEQLREGAEQQAATREILRLIARTSGDLQSVMDAIAENAAQLCDADDALVWRVGGNGRQLVSHFGASPTVDRLGEHQPVESRDTYRTGGNRPEDHSRS